MVSPVVASRIQHRRGLQTQFDELYPPGYVGVGGYNSPSWPDFTPLNYPNVLLPGEIVICTDTRNVYIGNVNGEYLQIAIQL